MTLEAVTLATAVVGAICGVLGTLPGVINTIHQLQRNRLRLKVVPQQAVPLGSLEEVKVNFCIEITNLSEFPVTITDVGFELDDKRTAKTGSLPFYFGSERLPQRLEPRSQYQRWFWLDASSVPLPKVSRAYARTACDNYVFGTSKALRAITKGGGGSRT